MNRKILKFAVILFYIIGFLLYLKPVAFADYTECFSGAQPGANPGYSPYSFYKYEHYQIQDTRTGECSNGAEYTVGAKYVITSNSGKCEKKNGGGIYQCSTSGSSGCGVIATNNVHWWVSDCSQSGYWTNGPDWSDDCGCKTVVTNNPPPGGGGGGTNTCSCDTWQYHTCGGGGCPSNEKNETRNCYPSGCADESKCSGPVAVCTPLPDLLVKYFHFPGADIGVHVNVQLIVKNAGNHKTTSPFTVSVHDGAGNSQRVTVNQDLSIGETVDLGSKFDNFSEPGPVGNYTATANVDINDDINESSEGNNDASDSYTTNKPLPDLIIVSDNTSSRDFTYPGGQINSLTNPTVWVKNKGQADVNKNFQVNVKDGNGLIKSYVVGSASPCSSTNTSELPIQSGGDTLDISCHFKGMKLPGSVNAGWTAHAIADVNGDINESDETNNDTTDTYNTTNNPPPDLAINAFSVPPSAATCLTVNPTVKIQNVGKANVSGPFVVSVTNKKAGGGQTINYTVPAATTLAPNETLDLSTPTLHPFNNLNIPDIPGSYTASVTVDPSPYSVPTDPNRVNNSRDDPYTATVTAACATYKVTGGVFNDLNGNGTKDSGESYVGSLLHIDQTNTDINTVANAQTTLSSTLHAGQYTIRLPYPFKNFASPPYVATWPPGGSANDPTRTINVGNNCDTNVIGTNDHGANCDTDASGNPNGNISNLNFGVWIPTQQQWFVGTGGDVRIDNSISSDPLPATRNIAVGNVNMTHGIFLGNTDNSLDLGSGGYNSDGWFVKRLYSQSSISTSYSIMQANLQKVGYWNVPPAKDLYANLQCSVGSQCSIGIPGRLSGVYKFNDDLTLGTQSFTNDSTGKGRNYIIMVEGNITIQGDINVDQGSTATFISSGSIIVGPCVHDLEGFFSADRNFTVQAGNCAGKPQTVLNIYGSIVANATMPQRNNPRGPQATFFNNRDLGDADNTAGPSVRVTYRPDFVLNAPDIMRFSNYQLKEVAPGN